VQSVRAKGGSKLQKRHLVQETTERLREVILAREPGAQIGSLKEVAQGLGVGIVTVQQAARVLEHEGLLEVRRGPGGGYYGARPDEAALERAFAAYMRVHGFGTRETQEMLSLLDCEIIPAAARCADDSTLAKVRSLMADVGLCDTSEARIAFELELRTVLFKVASAPLIELLCRVTTRLNRAHLNSPLFQGDEGIAAWKAGRWRILNAILERDEDLARFEAERYRQQVLRRLRQRESSGG
jgi:GntR family transcriptional repressor for pyruvate dehydrogenase complex